MLRQQLARTLTVSVLGALVAASVLVPSAGSATVKPGTAAQVKSLVAASTKIKKLSPSLEAQLATAPDDFSWTDYPALGPSEPSECLTPTDCVYGDTSGSKTIVLLGDSHAIAWLPAINPIAQTDGYKLIVLWAGACPAASVTIYYPPFGDPATCDDFQASVFPMIEALQPNVVLLAGKDSQLQTAEGVNMTASVWQAGLETTIKDFQSSSTKVGVLEDVPTYTQDLPACLSVNTTSVQKCTSKFPNPQAPGLQSAEKAAAKATKATYIETQNWFCTTKCSAVIGNFIPMIDTNHVSYAYASYLSKVMGIALAPLLK